MSFRLYELVWNRPVSSQIKTPPGNRVSSPVAGRSLGRLRGPSSPASGKIITFHGFLNAYVDDAYYDADREDASAACPPLSGRRAEGAGTVRGRTSHPHLRIHRGPPWSRKLEDLGDRPAVHYSSTSHILDRAMSSERHGAGPVVPRLRRGHLLELHFRSPGRLRLHRRMEAHSRDRSAARRPVPCLRRSTSARTARRCLKEPGQRHH